jgi:hypothetical protein
MDLLRRQRGEQSTKRLRLHALLARLCGQRSAVAATKGGSPFVDVGLSAGQFLTLIRNERTLIIGSHTVPGLLLSSLLSTSTIRPNERLYNSVNIEFMLFASVHTGPSFPFPTLL